MGAGEPWTSFQESQVQADLAGSYTASSFVHPRLLLPFFSTSFLKNCANLVNHLVKELCNVFTALGGQVVVFGRFSFIHLLCAYFPLSITELLPDCDRYLERRVVGY